MEFLAPMWITNNLCKIIFCDVVEFTGANFTRLEEITSYLVIIKTRSVFSYLELAGNI